MITTKDLWTHEGFACTDIDNLQFGKTNDDATYTFKEFDRFFWPDEFKQITADLINESIDLHPKFWIEDTIDLKEYIAQEIMNHVVPYGYIPSTEGWIDNTGNEVDAFIIAECIFEQESGIY